MKGNTERVRKHSKAFLPADRIKCNDYMSPRHILLVEASVTLMGINNRIDQYLEYGNCPASMWSQHACRPILSSCSVPVVAW
jgi:hypothetical protein